MGKIVLLTGGSRGLGKNAALRLSEKGFDVILTYHSKQEEANQVKAEVVAAGSRSATLQLDMLEI
ncbi:MAG TPA: SDR family NAD(P)-dependent oxidoreductase, partial [Daejeonella sp.]|nr:SDR family NAD(P)-dependent oxidoreductase [Daejeonella sp.]